MLVFVTTSLPDNDLGEMAKSSPFCNTCSCPASDLLITQLSVLIALCSLMIYGFFRSFLTISKFSRCLRLVVFNVYARMRYYVARQAGCRRR